MSRRIAFCISGQLRDEHLSLPHTARIAAELDADVFVSVWSRRGKKGISGATNVPQLARLFGPEYALTIPPFLRRRLAQAFPTLDEAMGLDAPPVRAEELRAYFPRAVIEVVEEGLDLSFPVRDSNSLRMLYLWWRCNRLKRAAETAAGVRYPAVLRFRPDVVPPGGRALPDGAACEGAVFLGGNAVRPGYAPDLLSFSTSDTDDLVASLFGVAVAKGSGNWSGIHGEFYKLLNGAKLRLSNIALGAGITEDYAAKQGGHRKALADLLERRAFDAAALPGGEHWAVLTAALRVAAATAERADGREALAGLMGAVEGVEALDALMPALAALSFAFERSGDFEAAIHCMIAYGGIDQTLAEDRQSPRSEVVSYSNRLGVLKAEADKAGQSLALDPVRVRVEDSVASRFLAGIFSDAAGSRLGDTMAEVGRNIDAPPEVARVKFEAAFAERDLHQAAEWAEKLVTAYPGNWAGYDARSKLEEINSAFEDALGWAEQAASRRPEAARLQLRVGFLQERLGRRVEAERTYLAAAELGAGDVAQRRISRLRAGAGRRKSV